MKTDLSMAELLALVEIVDAGDLAHALADVGEAAGDLRHPVGERLWNEMRPRVDAHHV